jgi:hypothetical protein
MALCKGWQVLLASSSPSYLGGDVSFFFFSYQVLSEFDENASIHLHDFECPFGATLMTRLQDLILFVVAFGDCHRVERRAVAARLLSATVCISLCAQSNVSKGNNDDVKTYSLMQIASAATTLPVRSTES